MNQLDPKTLAAIRNVGIGASVQFMPRWAQSLIADASDRERLFANIQMAANATRDDMERLRATGINPHWAYEHICRGKTIGEVIGMVSK